MIIFIYKIVNTINNKVYIGRTVNCKQRWQRHVRSAKKETSHIYNAMRKYGVDKFSMIVIQSCSSKEKANEIERMLIKEYNSLKNGYNSTEGGDGLSNPSKETRIKLSMAMKGKGHPQSEETKIKIALANKGQIPWIKGKKQSEEHKQKRADARRGQKHSEESKQKNREAHLGKRHSQETKQKMRKARSKRTDNGMRGKRHSEETRQKMRIAHKIRKIPKEFQQGIALCAHG